MAERIGIYAGSFDPVHAGHMAFALQAMAAAGLDRLYFLPERRPRHKHGVEHFGHRVAMLKRAIKPYKQFDILELPDIEFSVQRTLPRIYKQLGQQQLVFLAGSDVTEHITNWPHFEQLFASCELVIGIRAGQAIEAVKKQVEDWPVLPQAVTIFESFAADVSSKGVREGLRSRQATKGTLSSVQKYSNQHWLYVSVA